MTNQMHTTSKAKPGSVIAIFVLLILISAYQIVMGAMALIGAGNVDQVAEAAGTPAPPEWSVYGGAAIALVYGLVSVVLTVLVGKSHPMARPAVIGVNLVAGLVLLALIATPMFALDGALAAIFAFVVAGLMFTTGAKQHFAS